MKRDRYKTWGNRKIKMLETCVCVATLIIVCMFNVSAEEINPNVTANEIMMQENCVQESKIQLTGFQWDGLDLVYILEDGSRYVGWTEINGKKFYFDENGVMQRKECIIDGHNYQFSSTGELITGWYEKDGRKYYHDEYGYDEYGLIQDNGAVYYIDQDGLRIGEVIIGGNPYITDETGKIDLQECFLVGKETFYDDDGMFSYGWKISEDGYSYINNSGNMLTGLQNIGGNQYYFKQDGKVLLNDSYGLYSADEQGQLTRLPVTIDNLNDALDEILQQTGKGIPEIGRYVNGKLKYKYVDKMATREEMAVYALNNRKCSCYYYEALCGLLLERAGYQVITVKGKGQVYEEHYWSLVYTERNGITGWYHVDALKNLYIVTDAELVAHKFVWNHNDYPATPQ